MVAWAQLGASFALHEAGWERSHLSLLDAMSKISYPCGWKLMLALRWVLAWGFQLEYSHMAFNVF